MAAANNPDEINLELTQEEIWDDSTLVETWDQALKEYKKYHSIAATREDAEALIEAAETGVEEEEMKDAPAVDPRVGPAQVMDAESKASNEAPTVALEVSQQPKEPVETAAPTPQEPAQSDPPTFPFAQQHPAGPAAGYAIGGNDEAMRNLMMAWYWAGYYAGLLEGQQKALQLEQ